MKRFYVAVDGVEIQAFYVLESGEELPLGVVAMELSVDQYEDLHQNNFNRFDGVQGWLEINPMGE